MLMQEPSAEDIATWKQVFNTYAPHLKPNRKSGEKLLTHLRSRYSLRALQDADADQVVTQNILLNESLARELPPGTVPKPICCMVEPVGAGETLYHEQDTCFAGVEIFVGIDLVSGYFVVEGSSRLWDELYAFRGLNENDLANYYSVAQYIACLKRFDLLASI
jgi:hypothetical protein